MPVNGRRHLIDRSHAVHALEHAPVGVIAGQRRSLCPVSREPPFEHLRIVVRTHFLAARDHLGDPLLDALKQNALVHFQAR